MKFGAASNWTLWRQVTAGILCSTPVFGDPDPHAAKTCRCSLPELVVPQPRPGARSTVLELKTGAVSVRRGVASGWRDTSGYGHHALPSTSGVTGANRQFYRFEGTHGYMRIHGLHFHRAAIESLQVEMEFRTVFSGGDSWSLLDFARGGWFSIVVRGDGGQAMVSSCGSDGVQSDLVGTSAVNDGRWHVVKFTFMISNGLGTLELMVDGVSEKKVLGKHPEGIGCFFDRYGIIGHGSFAENKHSSQHFHGDIRAVKMSASELALV